MLHIRNPADTLLYHIQAGWPPRGERKKHNIMQSIDLMGEKNQRHKLGFGIEIDMNLYEFANSLKESEMKACNKTIKETLDLAETMITLSDKGDAVREDDGCGILYGVLRDSAYKIKKLAEAEKDVHQKKGKWT